MRADQFSEARDALRAALQLGEEELGAESTELIEALNFLATVRRKHLSKFGGEHAKELHRDVAKLCEELDMTAASRCEFTKI